MPGEAGIGFFCVHFGGFRAMKQGDKAGNLPSAQNDCIGTTAEVNNGE